jgi:polyhydroxybutyrate depolymerase
VTLQSGGEERWYFRHVPTGYDASTPTPLIVDLHGYSEGATIHVKMSALGPYGDSHGFVTITPQGTGVVPRWNNMKTSADMQFLRDALDQAEHALCIDTNRVYATGLSNGAMMTSGVACALADRVAAVAPVAGVANVPGCDPARPVPVIAFHGTADPFLSYDGGFGPAVANLPAPDGSGRKFGDLGVRQAKRPSVISAEELMWKFFEAHPLRNGT